MRSTTWAGAGCGVAMGLAIGCGPGSGDTAADTGSADTELATTGGATAVADTTAGSESTGAPAEPGPARGGISVDWVQANQGVGVIIGADGGEVGPTDRAAPLIQDRITLIRAFWSVPDDWTPREIEGRLIVDWPDGTEVTLTDSKVVDADAFEGDLGRSFYWGLMADQVVPGIKYRVELYETSFDHDALPESSPAPMLPADGSTAFVGIEDSYQVIKVVVVPFVYDDGAGCSTTPDTSEDTMRRFQDLMYMQNPIDRLDFTVHEPIIWDTPLESFFQLNSYMAGLRFDEGALPETYYFGLVDVCSGGLGGAGGQAIDIPVDPVNPDSASGRVSSGLSLDADWSSETFVHEVGHTQGRRHVACDGEGGPDPTYPHEGGDVGEWGFGVIDFGLRHPTFYKDYMTYCHPTWVGAWGWNKVYPVIRGLSQWDRDFPGGAVAPEGGTQASPEHDPYSGSMLLGMIEPGGREHWITVPGGVPGHARGGMRFQFASGGKVVADELAYVHQVQDGAGTVVMVPLPEGWSEVDAVTRIEGTRRRPLSLASVDQHHRNRTIVRARTR